MSLTALLVTNDRVTRDQFSAVLEKTAVSVETASAPDDAMKKLATNHYDAVVIDFENKEACGNVACENLQDAIGVLEALRQGRSNRTAIVFALIGNRAMMKPAYVAGANFVFQRPLTNEALARGMRAAHGQLLRAQAALAFRNLALVR